MKVLLTGGVGYIGSHIAANLARRGIEVVIIDNLSNSSKKNAQDLKDYYLEISGKNLSTYFDTCSVSSYERIFSDHSDIDSIIHLAAFKSVPASTQTPSLYYENNLGALTSTLLAAETHGVKNFIFSSSCTVYGEVKTFPVNSRLPLGSPESPYGHTKQIGESIVKEFSKYTGIRSVSLRYFNPAGSDSMNRIGETDLDGASIFSSLCRSALSGQEFIAFGSDYPTRDGSCVRDYIHIEDLAEAHVLALEKIEKVPEILNLGSGNGFSVLECWKSFCEANGIEVKLKLSERRPGDISEIWADIEEASTTLGWKPQRTLRDICKSHYEWFKKDHKN